MILLTSILLIVLIGSFLIFINNDDPIGKKTLVYFLIITLIIICKIILLWALYKKINISVFAVFIINAGIALVLGIIHTYVMYTFIWTQRDSLNWSKDSIAKEAFFTFSLAAVITLLDVYLQGYLILNIVDMRFLWSQVITFPFPFILMKAVDFMLQIPEKEFDKKWFYELYPFDENEWKRENLISINFVVCDSFANEKRWFKPRAHFRTTIPRDQQLRLIYRFALREYDRKKPSIPVQDLGYEEGSQKFWWLFFIPFILWKPETWRRQPRYLDPLETLSTNQLHNGDYIIAKRMIENN